LLSYVACNQHFQAFGSELRQCRLRGVTVSLAAIHFYSTQ